MFRFRSLLLIILLAALLAAPLATAQLSEAQQESLYQQDIDRLPSTQNSDGGFGPVVEVIDSEGNSTNITKREHASFIQTVLTVHLLVWENETNRLETWKNWEGKSTSLARSNATSARDWLQQYEKDHEASLTPGDYALLALAYNDLGDDENARQLVIGLLDEESGNASHMGAMDVARLIFTQEQAGIELNGTQSATLEDLEARLQDSGLSAPEPLAWALLAQPEHGERRAKLADRLNGDLSVSLSALGAWALAASGGPDQTTRDSILAVHQWDPDTNTLERTYHLLAERTAYPQFSKEVSLFELNAEQGARGNAPAGTPGMTEEESAAAEPPETQQPGGEPGGSEFPLPTWMIMTAMLLALAVLMVTGLAYGLKREDLDGPRKNIFDYIDSNPGEHFSKIRRDLGLAPGTFQHHLSVLESGGWITSYKDARYKRYFVNGNRYKQMIAGYQYKQKFAALANGTTRDLVQFIREHPGVTQKEVALRLNLHASTVNWHANRLKQAGILNPERVGREVRYHVDTDVVQKMMQQANN